MVDEIVMAAARGLATLCEQRGIESVTFHSDRESEYQFSVTVYDQEGNVYTGLGVRNG